MGLAELLERSWSHKREKYETANASICGMEQVNDPWPLIWNLMLLFVLVTFPLEDAPMLLSPSMYCSPYNKPVNQKTRWGVEARKSDFLQKAHRPRRWWTSVLKNFFYTKNGGGVAGVCRFPGPWILCSYSCPPKSSHNDSVNLQIRQMLASALQLFASIWIEQCYTFNGQSHEYGLSCLFHAIGHIL